MATKAELRTRLQRRLGLGVVSSVESERLGEALNSGIARALSDGVPGLSHDLFVGSVYGALATSGTGADVSAGGTTFTLGVNPLTGKVFPHDILNVVESGTTTKFLIRDVKDADEVDVGSPVPKAYNGDTNSTITRRAIELPSTGQVVGVWRHSGSDTPRAVRLAQEPLFAHADPYKTGTPRFYEQRFSENQGASFISLWPAPTSNTDQFTIVQTRFIARLDSDSDTLIFPEEALDAVLERARMAYITWVGTHASTKVALASEAVRDSADSLKNTANSNQVMVKQ